MIGKVVTGNGFRGLLDYLLAGSDGRQHDRVEWLTVRNLATEEADLLPAIMRSTAAQSERVEKPVYHLVIGLEPEERLERAQLEQIVDRTLKDLDLEEHQAVVVAHGDTDHQHVHVMLNRVHPESRIVTVEGDVVEITIEGVFVAGRWLQPSAPSRSARGQHLRTLPLGRYEIGPGQFWLAADHPRSWDSRYFGPVDAGSVLGTYRPLWTWAR